MQNSACRMPAFGVLLVAILIAAAGCSRARAQTVPDGPPLAVPLPPAHEIVVEQTAEAPPPEPEPVLEPAVVPPPRTTATRPPARPEPRTDTATSPPVPATPAPAVDAPAVRATPTAAAAADERKVRDLIAKAAGDLNRVNYKRLSTEGQSQYDQSKRFSEEAQQAIKERNFLFALTLAEKAATLAAELAGR